MMDAKEATRRAAGFRAGHAVLARAAEKRQDQEDKVRAKELAEHMIGALEVAVDGAIFRGATRAYNYIHETSRPIQSMAFHDYIVPHFQPLGYTLDWECKDDYGVEESGRVTFGVTLTWGD